MKSAFNPVTGKWEIRWPGRVAKHDLVYLSPPSDPMQGIPLGNGDVGALVWCEDSRLIINFNKCDLWEDGKASRVGSGDDIEGEITTLRHAGRIIIDFKLPVFDLFYLYDFNARLNMADALMELAVDSPFGSVSLRAFVDHQSGVFNCELERKFTEPAPLEIILERFGSNTFSRWYSSISRNPRVGLQGAEACADHSGVYVQHALGDKSFAVGCRVFKHTGAGIHYQRRHAHAASVNLEGKLKQKITLAVGVTSPVAGNPVTEVKIKINAAGVKGFAGLLTAHRKAWRSFWLRSYMECGDDYLDNLWHLTMYYAHASQSGSYPGRFINALWNWNRDVQPWNHYFHWNQQQTYWPLNAAGHHELMDAYLDYRFKSLAHARQDARELFNADGAFISDLCDRHGDNVATSCAKHLHTPVAQIAMDFWRQYCYTGDRVFLRTRALPFMLEAARFFESCFEKEKDGLYHARGGYGYEGALLLKDGVTELACAKVLFAAVLQALDAAAVPEPRRAKWQDILEHLSPLKLLGGGPEFFAKCPRGWVLKRGFFKGDLVSSDHLVSAGFGIEDQRYLTTRTPNHEKPAWKGGTSDLIRTLQSDMSQGAATPALDQSDFNIHNRIFPVVESAAVFPSGLIGLAQKQSGEYTAMVATTKLYAPDIMGWDPFPIVLARLGLAAETWKILRMFPSRWQLYCNGFGHYGPKDCFTADAALRFRCNMVNDNTAGPDSGKIHPFPAWPFRHMGMESMSVLACAMNEALLQSYAGVLRVAPAVSPVQNARFTLHAVGGFVVSAEIVKGRPAWIHIKSLRGATCRLHNPWAKASVFSGNRRVRATGKALIEFKTVRNGCYRIVADAKRAHAWTVTRVVCSPNQNSKTSADGHAVLGLPRMYARYDHDCRPSTEFVQTFKVSQIRPKAMQLQSLQYPEDKNALNMTARRFEGRFADIHMDPGVACSGGVMYYAVEIDCRTQMKLEICLGYDGPVKCWADRREVFQDPLGTNPAWADKSRIAFNASKGRHEIMIALCLNHGKAWGIFLRFKRLDASKQRLLPEF